MPPSRLSEFPNTFTIISHYFVLTCLCFFKSKRVYIYIHIISAWYPSVHLFTLICVCFISLPAPKSENFLGVKNPIPRIIIPTYPLWAKHTWLYSNSWYPQIWLVIVELYLGIFEDIINHLTINMLSPDIYIYIAQSWLYQFMLSHLISPNIHKFSKIVPWTLYPILSYIPVFSYHLYLSWHEAIRC